MICFCFYIYGAHRDLHVLPHPYPTRRSSDLVQELEYVDFRIGTEFLSLEQRGDKVFVRARRSDTDEVETIEADYVVGADGARSKVRDAIGATMVGTRSRTGYYNFIIHAPGLHQAHDPGPGVVY